MDVVVFIATIFLMYMVFDNLWKNSAAYVKKMQQNLCIYIKIKMYVENVQYVQ